MAAAAGLVAAVAAALGALLMAPGLTQPHGEASPEGSGPGSRGGAAERRPPGRMDQALLLVRNELPAQGLRLAALSGACHQVSGGSGGGVVPGVCHPRGLRCGQPCPGTRRGRLAFLASPRGFVGWLRFGFTFLGSPAAGAASVPAHLPLSLLCRYCKAAPPPAPSLSFGT